ncbi:MAG: hypothetical protein QOJ65_2636 [Fimbriimonadaceae bacterium]|jgi:hypothetical protein|nr:hypothetical protein [Fimbriimonadaceae bacterium]
MKGALALPLLAFGSLAFAQPVLLDHAVKAGGLYCFPVSGREGEYRYLPAQLRLGTNGSGGPEFSFLRYVQNVKRGGEEAITEGEGGGILHFLMQMDTPNDMLMRAQGELAGKTGKPAKLMGPLVFKAGRYNVISSFKDKNGVQRAFMSGNAPIFEGQKVAISMGLDKLDSQILSQSFQTATPDISVAFELEFEGLTDAYEAELTVDWTEVQKDEHSHSSTGMIFFKVEVDKIVQSLERKSAIKLVTKGEHKPSEEMLAAMYDRVTSMVFSPVQFPPETPAAEAKQEGGLLGSLGPGSGAMFNPLKFNVSSGYRMRTLQVTGKSTVSMNHMATAVRGAMLTANIGDIYKKYGTDQAYFRTVNLADPVYSQREVTVMLDGSILNDFDRYINNVTVSVRKRHQDGNTTLQEFVVTKDEFVKSANRFQMVYGVQGDTDRDKWLDYEYKCKWSFKDGGEFEQGWKQTSVASVSIQPPYELHEVRIDADNEKLKGANVRYALVKLEFDYFGKNRRMQLPYKTGVTQPSTVVLVQPRGTYDYNLEIEWFLQDGKRLLKPAAKSDSGIILVDELPTAN